MSIRNPAFLASLFSRPFLHQVLSGDADELLNRLDVVRFPLPNNPTVATIYDALYQALLRDYRCEYVYKNAIAAKVLVARHSNATAAILHEQTVGTSQADLVLLNGTSIAYEIKTELDSFRRLSTQLDSYRQAFDRVYLVGPESLSEALLEVAPESVGVLVLRDRYTIREIRPAESCLRYMQHRTLFNLLRQPEYRAVTARHFGVAPQLPNTQLYRACQELLFRLPISVLHDEVVRALKRRSSWSLCGPELKTVPHSLKFHAALGTINQQNVKRLAEPMS